MRLKLENYVFAFHWPMGLQLWMTPTHCTCWQISRLAVCLPTGCQKHFSSAKQIPKERDLSVWCVNFIRGEVKVVSLDLIPAIICSMLVNCGHGQP